MADFSLCSDTDCPSRKTCRRATTSPAPHQWYAEFPREPGWTKCNYYMVDERVLWRRIRADLDKVRS